LSTGIHLPSNPAEEQRAERVLATARAFLAVCALVAVYLDPTEPTRYAALAYGLFLVYVTLSFLILISVRLRPGSAWSSPLLIHGTDVLWAATITLFTQGPSSPFFVFFVFVLIAAAYRWGFRETLATAALAVALLFLQVFHIAYGGVGALQVEEQLEFNRILMRATYLLLMGVLLGYLAEEEKHLRAEAAAVARVLSLAQRHSGLRASLQAVLEELLRLFDARRALLAVRETQTGRCFLWDVARASGDGSTLRLHELDSSSRTTFLFSTPASAWSVHKVGDRFETVAVDSDGGAPAVRLPDSFLSDYPAQSVWVVNGAFGEEWVGRLFLLDVSRGPALKTNLRFLHALLRQVAPALNNQYLVRRLRSRASAMERARVARELHDGAIQSLVAIELQVEALRRAARKEQRPDDDLARLQRLLREEAVNLRELMQQLNPPALDPKQLLDYIADTVEKFRRETGIAAQFMCELEEVSLPPRVCRELARILQEALVNVRKHSRAGNVLVQFTADPEGWRLVVDDDGRGFEFSGRLSQTELDAARKGPLVIKERVRSIGAELEIESDPGRGARLEIRLPRNPHG